MWLDSSNQVSKRKLILSFLKTSLSVNLVLNQSPSPPQQYSCSKDQDAAEDRVSPSAGAAGVRKGSARHVSNDNRQFTVHETKQIVRIFDQRDRKSIGIIQ